MYKENSNAVIHLLLPYLNGGLFDAFEYFTGIYNYSKTKDIYLFYLYQKNKYETKITKSFMNNLLEIFKDKYINIDECLNNILFIDNTKIVRYKFDKVLFLDNHTPHISGNRINAKEYLYIVDPFIPSLTDYKKLNDRDNATVYSEPRYYKEKEND